MASFRFALGAAVVLGVASGAALAAGDLAKQTPIEVTVDLGSPGKHEFAPKQLKFETGKLYKLILRNTSSDPHYFTSHAFSQMVFTRKVQVTQQQNGKAVTLAEAALTGGMRAQAERILLAVVVEPSGNGSRRGGN